VHYTSFACNLTTRIAADMFSTFSSDNNIKTIGLDIRDRQLGDDEEVEQLRRLDDILARRNFPVLSKLLIRLDFDAHYPDLYGSHPNPEEDQSFESNAKRCLNIIHDVFPKARACGILEVESLTYERRRLGRGIIIVIDDCLSPQVSR
jgi:hypothetical protein